jgi:penicillin-binding protein 1C
MRLRTAGALALLCAATASHALPTFAEVRAAHKPSDITLTDRHGVPIQTLRVDKNVRRLPWVPLGEMSPALLQAVLLSEDRRFYEHSGVDWSAVAKSAWGNVWNSRTRGASTLTMQLAGLIDDGLARPGGGRSVRQKLGQVLTASKLEANWKKSEILEAYLNSVAFRGEVVGIDALSLTLFGKHPSGLDAQEAALTAALLRGDRARAKGRHAARRAARAALRAAGDRGRRRRRSAQHARRGAAARGGRRAAPPAR